MNSCKDFAKKYPILIVALTTVLVFVLLKITDLFPAGPFSLGISELFMAIVITAWTFLFMGKEKISFNFSGFKYTFKFFRTYLIAMAVIGLIFITTTFYAYGVPSDFSVNILNYLITGLTVGIVEEFTFRGLVFGGILQKIGNSKKSIIAAAVISGALFGAMHVVDSALCGEITSLTTLTTSLLKICQTGIFGVVLAFIYFKTRNLLSVAALHGLNDFILFFIMASNTQASDTANSYVSGDFRTKLVGYILFTLIMVPMFIKGIRNIKENEAIPFDDDFLPRAVQYEKKSKKH